MKRFENLLKSVKPLRDKVSLGGGGLSRQVVKTLWWCLF